MPEVHYILITGLQRLGMLLADTFQTGYDVRKDKVIRLSIRCMTRIILKEDADYCEFKENNCNPFRYL
ncbi:MAG: hypothetical protein A2Z09_02520 [Nitrospirae bacterium RBG_16_43_8]|nr:MAG: hypothetical protein A2Z09_02520 [Nitrospirae bacterium RBG_16_43_8]